MLYNDYDSKHENVLLLEGSASASGGGSLHTKGSIMSESNQPEEFTAQEKLRQVQSNFGAAAQAYVTSNVHAQGQDLGWLVEELALSGTERVLDVATGAGHTAFALASYVAEVVALDITPQMLVVAQQGAIERHLDNIRFLQGNAQALPCTDASFDVVTCRQAPHHFPDVRQGIGEWAHVLKSGGKLALVDSIAPEEEDADLLLQEIEVLRDPSHVRNYHLSAWRAMLTEAGFSVHSMREWGIMLDIPSWTQRMRTPAEAVRTIEQRLRQASPSVRQRLQIGEQNGVLTFRLPSALIVAIKTKEQ